MRTMNNIELERVLQEEKKQRYYYSDYLDLNDPENVFSCEFITEEDYPQDWYCRIMYDVYTSCDKREGSNHEVIINQVYIDFQEVEITPEQDKTLTKVLTARANEEFQYRERAYNY